MVEVNFHGKVRITWDPGRGEISALDRLVLHVITPGIDSMIREVRERLLHSFHKDEALCRPSVHAKKLAEEDIFILRNLCYPSFNHPFFLGSHF